MDDFGGKLRKALDDTVGASAKAREAEEKFRRELEEMGSEALSDLKWKWRAERMSCAKRVERAVFEYGRAISRNLKSSLTDDGRMPATINYLERYSAMKSIQDRNQLLLRIEQTMDLAKRAIERSQTLDPQSAVSDAAFSYRLALMKLSDIRVAPVEEAEPEEDAPIDSRDREALLASLEGAAEASFDVDALLGKDRLKEGESFKERRQAFENSLGAAKKDAEESHAKQLRANAGNAVGKTVALDDLPEFSGSVSCSTIHQRADLEILEGLVCKSFDTYRQVVRDNGLFAAFSEGSPFGKCRGYLSWMSSWDDWSAESFEYDDSEYGGDFDPHEYLRSRIPTAIEDLDKDGDTLQTAIQRMREFASRRYMGILDDDFKQHVDAFWYGFGKLMEFINGMVELDLGKYQSYCSRLTTAASARCGDLAMLMDDGQLAAYCEELEQMRDAVRAE